MCYPETNEQFIEFIFQNYRKEKIAIYDGANSCTYAELKKYCQYGKAFLSKLNLPPKSKIAVIGYRSSKYIATVLSIVSAGFTFIPVDIINPQERIKTLLHDAEVNAIINFQQTINLSQFTCPIIDPEEMFFEHSNVLQFATETATSDNDVLYIIYTSGSTGNPKGVEITVGGLTNTLLWMKETFDIQANDRIAFKTSIGFTDSIWEIFLPLLCGASLVVFSQMDTVDPHKLYEKLSAYEITITQFVPVALEIFLSMADSLPGVSILPHLKWIFNGGEHPSIEIVKHLYQKTKNCIFANLYGMTECSIYATSYIVNRSSIEKIEKIPSGYPITNTNIQIFSSNNVPLPANTMGEIGISGKGLARRYVNDPDLTSKKFIFFAGKRIYLSGDIGYLDENGCLWYCGRKDYQVKIRGFRVELMDVEAQLMKISQIDMVAVVAKENKFADRDLWCYYSGNISEEEIKTQLHDKLPEYMIPKFYIKLSKFPLTINNKIDRKELAKINSSPVPVFCKTSKGTNEKIFLRIWGSILEGNKDITIYDDFFDIGGDSIKAARMQILLEKEGISVSLHDIVECRTIDKLLNKVK